MSFLYRILSTTQTPDEELYDYISSSLVLWEGLSRGVANFHLCFLLTLLPYFGIAPDLPDEEARGDGNCFSLQEQCYLPHREAYCLSPEETQHLPLFLRMSYDTMHGFAYSRQQRGVFLITSLTITAYTCTPSLSSTCLPILRQLGQSAERN